MNVLFEPKDVAKEIGMTHTDFNALPAGKKFVFAQYVYGLISDSTPLDFSNFFQAYTIH